MDKAARECKKWADEDSEAPGKYVTISLSDENTQIQPRETHRDHSPRMQWDHFGFFAGQTNPTLPRWLPVRGLKQPTALVYRLLEHSF